LITVLLFDVTESRDGRLIVRFDGIKVDAIWINEENTFFPFSRIIFNSSFSRNLWILYKIHPEENLSSQQICRKEKSTQNDHEMHHFSFSTTQKCHKKVTFTVLFSSGTPSIVNRLDKPQAARNFLTLSPYRTVYQLCEAWIRRR
jgi:hypothetical protein